MPSRIPRAPKDAFTIRVGSSLLPISAKDYDPEEYEEMYRGAQAQGLLDEEPISDRVERDEEAGREQAASEYLDAYPEAARKQKDLDARLAKEPKPARELGTPDSHIMVDFGQGPEILPRGDMDDAAWARIKDDAARKGKLVQGMGGPAGVGGGAPGSAAKNRGEASSEPAPTAIGSFKGAPVGEMVTQATLQAAPGAQPPSTDVSQMPSPFAPAIDAMKKGLDQGIAGIPDQLIQAVPGGHLVQQAYRGLTAGSGHPDAPPAPGKGPVAADLVQKGPATPEDQGALSMSMAMQGLPAIPGDATKGFEKRIDSAAALQSKAIDKAAEVEARGLAAKADLQRKAMETRLEGQQMEQEIAIRRQVDQESAREAYESTVKHLGEIQKVDPNRVWNSMETGNKVLAGIAVALSGMANAALGNGNNSALDIIRSAIKADTEAQQANIENRRGALKDTAAGQLSAYDMLRQQGMDEIEAHRASEAAKIEAVQLQIDQLASQIGSEEALAKAETLKAALEQEKNKLLMPVIQHRDQMAIERAKLGLQKVKIGLSASGDGGGKRMREQILVDTAEGQTAYHTIKDLEAGFKDVSGLTNKLTAIWPTSDAAKFNQERDVAIRKVAKFIDQSVLQKWDIETWDQVFPKAGEIGGENKLKVLRTMLQESYQNRKNALRGAGYGVPSSFDNTEDDPDLD